ncbi:MAG: S1 family peptidase, partial [Acidimicrobiales bacterium]
QYHLDQTNGRVNTLINGYKKQFANAESQLNASAATARQQIRTDLGPLQKLNAAPEALNKLVKKLGPSLFFVHTLDQNGQPSVGTGFVIASNGTQSLLLTSYTTVAAATRSPSPPVFVRQGTGPDTTVTVRTWDPQYDLALIVLPKGNLPVVISAAPKPAEQIGNRLYALSGSGSAGGAISDGTVTDVSANGVASTVALGTDYQGGPLVNANGEVVAVASRTYSPLGFATSGVWYAPYVQAACNKVLTCPNGNVAGAQ